MKVDDFDTHNEAGLEGMLLTAIEKNQIDLVKSLIQKGASLAPKMNSRPVYHEPLYLACSFDHDEIVAYLIDAGVDVNARDCSAIAEAVVSKSVKSLHLLVQAGGDIHVGDDRLMRYAVYSQSKNVIDIFYDADPAYYLALFDTDPELSMNACVDAYLKHRKLSLTEYQPEQNMGESSRIKRERLGL